MKNLVLSVVLLCSISIALGQIAVSDTFSNPVPDPSALIDMQSYEKGFLPPRMNQTQRDNIASPADGLIIFNTDNGCVQINMAQQGWTDIACDCSNPPSGGFTGNSNVSQFASNLYNASQAGQSYSWVFTGGSPAISNSASPSVSWSVPGSYLVTLTTTDALGCSTTDSMTVTVNPCTPPSPAFTGATTTIINVATQYTATAAGQNYQWTFQSGSPATSTSSNPSVTWTATGTYNVQLIVTDANGCADTSNQSITVLNCVTGGSQTFNYTGAMQTFTVPAGVCDVTIQAWGAEGGDCGFSGGQGGYATGDLTVTGGDILYVYVGGQGTNNSQGSGGFNGGGTGGIGDGTGGAGGGGASDIRINGTNLTDRIIVAAGGGGSGCQAAGGGGDGGAAVGQDGALGGGGCGSCNNSTQRDLGGSGGTQVAGGAGGTYIFSCYTGYNPPYYGAAGTLGNGGSAFRGGGGGGGGYYGGGQGGGCYEASGGGGSSYIGGVTSASMTQGGRSGNGQVIISW